MIQKLNTGPVATGLVLVFALVGGALVIISALVHGIDADLRLSFSHYLEAMAVATGGLAIGRGLNNRAPAAAPAARASITPDAGFAEANAALNDMIAKNSEALKQQRADLAAELKRQNDIADMVSKSPNPDRPR